MRIRYVTTCISLMIVLMTACDFELDENVPLGNKELTITGINPKRGLRGDTLTIYGAGFNSIAYQNTVAFEEEAGGGEIRVVDATPDSIKVIIPDLALTGDVKVFFGVDTVKSPEIFELISTVKRPTIISVNPEFAVPGTEVIITANFQGGEPIVLFGETYVKVSSTGTGNGILTWSVRVPPILPGPVDLRAAIVTPEGDSLWSKPVSMGVLPGITDLPFMVWTGQTSHSSGLYDISKGELTEDEGFVVEVLYPEAVPNTTKQGVALDAINNNVYWISNNYNTAGSALYHGKITGEKPSDVKLGRQFNDIAISNGYIYLAGGLDKIHEPGWQNIRRYPLDNNGNIILNTAKVLYTDAARSEITNLKIEGDNFYWCDSYGKKIYKAELLANGTLGSPTPTVIFSGAPLTEPIAIAIDEINDVFYIADRTGSRETDKTILWKGSLSAPGEELIKLYEKQTTAKITDLEIDIEDKFLYWITTDGIFRKAFDKLTGFSTAEPTPVYHSAGGNYFDF